MNQLEKEIGYTTFNKICWKEIGNYRKTNFSWIRKGKKTTQIKANWFQLIQIKMQLSCIIPSSN